MLASTHYAIRPLVLEKLPAHGAPHMRGSAIWIAIGSVGALASVKNCLFALHAEGVVERTLDDSQPGHPANAYRLAARAEVEAEPA